MATLRRTLRPLLLATAAAVVAGTAFVLGLSAVLDLYWDPRAAVVLALAAIWVPQTLLFAHRGIRRR